MGWFSKLVYGVDLDAEQQTQDRLDAQLAALNQAKLDRGSYDQETFLLAEAQRQSSVIDVNAQVGQAFDEGLSQGAANIRGAVGGTVNTLLTNAASVMPWQLWVAALVFVFFSMGGPKWIGKLARAR